MKTIEEYAQELAGNWIKFQCFAWSRQWDLENPEQWTIVYTHNRDSGLLDESNASAIEKRLAPFINGDDGDILEEHHGHWACGWIDGYAIRVFGLDGAITPAFQEWYNIQCELEDYPVLDEEDYSNREYEACLDAIEQECKMLDNCKADIDASAIYSWLSDNGYDGELENTDDRGAYPSTESIEAACNALGYILPDE